MKKLILTFSFLTCCLLTFSLTAQNNTIEAVNSTANWHESLFQINENASDKDVKNYVKEATFLTLNKAILQRMMDQRPNQIRFSLPTNDNRNIELELQQHQVLTEDFILNTSANTTEDYRPGLYFQGNVIGNKNYRAAISIFEDMVMGMIFMDGETYVLGHLEQDHFPAGAAYVLYKDSDMNNQNPFTCGTDDLHNMGVIGDSHNSPSVGGDRNSANSVKIYFEADYRMYQDKGNNTTTVTNYVTGLYNNVITIYSNESIETEISELYVWTTPDPYPSNSSGDALTAFRNRLGGNFNGDLAHLLSTVNAGNGGVAYVDVLCVPTYAVAYSNIGNTYSNFPTYSWTVNVVAHEMGHNLGSPHTQSCSWPGGAIDNCYTTEGGCAPGPAPTNGGTVMSYCHLTSYGINLNNGFGPLPGDLIRAEVAGASCLTPGNGGGGGGGGTPNLTEAGSNLNVSGTTVNASVSVTNNGNDNAGASVVDFYLSTDGTLSTSNDYFIGSSSISALSAGASTSVNFSKNVASDAPTGTYRVIFAIDGSNQVSESNENDNIFSWSSPLVTITTTPVGYCPSAGNNATYEWIANVNLNTINNSSGTNGGYGDFTSVSTNLEQGSSNPFSATPGYSGQVYSELWRVWIDFNQDQDFDDAGELVYDSGVLSGTTSGSIDIPSNAPLGSTRMRVSMKWLEEDNVAQNPCSTFGYGEVEDYSVNIVEASEEETCSIDNITAGNQTACDPANNTYSQDVTVYYSCSNTDGMVEIHVNGNYLGAVAITGSPQTITINGLAADGNAVDIKAGLCLTGESCLELTKNNLFTAPADCTPTGGTCDSYPDNRSYTNLTTSSVTLTWDAEPEAVRYRVRIRVRVGSSWSSWYYFYAYGNSLNLTGLSPSTRYQYRVRTQCSTGWTTWSPRVNFTSPANMPDIGNILTSGDVASLPSVIAHENSLDMGSTMGEGRNFGIYPNPATNEISLQVFDHQMAQITITDMNGRVVRQVPVQEGIQQLNISDLEKGIYFIMGVTADSENVVQRLVKM